MIERAIWNKLSGREREVLIWRSMRLRKKLIASKMSISENTVKELERRIRVKTGMSLSGAASQIEQDRVVSIEHMMYRFNLVAQECDE